MQQPENTITAVLEESGLTLNELAALCAVKPDWVILHIEEGFLDPLADNQNELRFSSASLLRAQRILQLERDFDAVPELAALVADMQEEISKLKHRLSSAGIE
ncbi:MAG: chaperone modulator CbpM [Methylomonas sp.]|jgi:chaperone modulatory protein CbpM